MTARTWNSGGTFDPEPSSERSRRESDRHDRHHQKGIHPLPLVQQQHQFHCHDDLEDNQNSPVDARRKSIALSPGLMFEVVLSILRLTPSLLVSRHSSYRALPCQRQAQQKENHQHDAPTIQPNSTRSNSPPPIHTRPEMPQHMPTQHHATMASAGHPGAARDHKTADSPSLMGTRRSPGGRAGRCGTKRPMLSQAATAATAITRMLTQNSADDSPTRLNIRGQQGRCRQPTGHQQGCHRGHLRRLLRNRYRGSLVMRVTTEHTGASNRPRTARKAVTAVTPCICHTAMLIDCPQRRRDAHGGRRQQPSGQPIRTEGKVMQPCRIADRCGAVPTAATAVRANPDWSSRRIMASATALQICG